MSRIRVGEWLEAYKKAWERRDANAAAALFTEDATYHEKPYDPPLRGSAGVHAYWTKVTATQSDVRLSWGAPVVEGNRAAVQWWTNLKNDGADITLAGAMFLTFATDGRCTDLTEYWHFGEGELAPQPGWGS